MLRYALVLPFLLLLLLGYAHPQSLGDIARDLRAEKQKSTSPLPPVITNEDIASRSKSSEPSTREATPNASPNQRQQDLTSNDKQERDAQQHTDEINRSYLERIAALRRQITATRIDITKLQGEFINRTLIYELYPEAEARVRDQQALAFNRRLTEAIDTQRHLLADLELRLDALQEEARHVGVPHATD